jgi:gas vesicle protein
MRFDIDDALDMVGLYRANKALGFGGFLLGVGVGAVVGAGVAMLFTPYSGPESRERLARVGEDLKNQVGETVRQIQTQGEQIAQRITGPSPSANQASLGNNVPAGSY